MVLQAKQKAAATTAATRGLTLTENSGIPGIAIFVIDSAAKGVEFAEDLLSGMQKALVRRGLSFNPGTDMGLDARLVAGCLGQAQPRVDGLADERARAFADLIGSSKSPKTAQGYFYDVRRVLNVISTDNFDGAVLGALDLSQVTLFQVQAAEQKLFKNTQIKPRTLARLKQGWNRFCAFLGMEAWRFSEVVNAVREYRDDVISNDDVNKMLDYCRMQRDVATRVPEIVRWYRIEISIRLGWDMGFRSCEYGNATFDEVEHEGRITINHSKHNGTRTIAVTDETQAVILEFKNFLLGRNLYPAGGGIFEKQNGKSYSTSSFRRWLKKVAIVCGVSDKQAKTHGLRHRFAKNFYSHTHDEFMLADILGHKSTKTTRIYAAPTFENMRAAIQSTSNSVRTSHLDQTAA